MPPGLSILDPFLTNGNGSPGAMEEAVTTAASGSLLQESGEGRAKQSTVHGSEFSKRVCESSESATVCFLGGGSLLLRTCKQRLALHPEGIL